MEPRALAAIADALALRLEIGTMIMMQKTRPSDAIVLLEAALAGHREAGDPTGPQALAVTTNLNINFLTRAGPGELIARCRILKLGKRLVVTDCDITADGSDDLIAQASATYSIPPAR